MATLHIFSQADDGSIADKQKQQLIDKEDIALLIEDACYTTITPINIVCSCYALEPDLETRGLLERVMPQYQIISYAGFVELTERHPKIIHW